jgi:hypothetical protein
MLFINSLEHICNFLNVNIDELPINIYTPDFTFMLCFYFNEDDHNIIVFVTDEEGKERLVCIQKKNIHYFEVVYQQDIDELMSDDPEKLHRVNYYE